MYFEIHTDLSAQDKLFSSRFATLQTCNESVADYTESKNWEFKAKIIADNKNWHNGVNA